MKKSKTFYWVTIVCIFIFLWIPYFQNIGQSVNIVFLAGSPSFLRLYPWVLFLGMVEGVLITIFIQTLLKDIKYQEPKKFDLN